MYIDTHCHLFNEDYNDVSKVIKKLKNNIIIVSGTNGKTNKEVIEIVDKYDNVFGTLGIHPEEVNNYNEDDLKFLENNLTHPKIVAVGEIGLDYYWNKENLPLQRDLFIKQILLASKYKKAVVIHSRESLDDVYNILDTYKNLNLKIVLHCYSGDYNTALKFLDFNTMFGVGGIITFKNNQLQEDFVKKIDISKILLETDSPYLTPVPYRGQKNTPEFIPIIADKIADIKQMNVSDLYDITTANAIEQFDLIPKL